MTSIFIPLDDRDVFIDIPIIIYDFPTDLFFYLEEKEG